MKNIIIEKTTICQSPFNLVPVFINHNEHDRVGMAKVSINSDGFMIADIEFLTQKKIPSGKYYPSIGYQIIHINENGVSQKNVLHQLGLCVNKNIDETIQPIKL